MKYVSPQTEKRKQLRKKRRKQQMLICAVLLVIILIAAAIVTLTSVFRDDTPSSETESISSSQQEEFPSEENEEISSTEKEDGTEENAEKPKKKKKPLFSGIKSLFSKTEPIPVTFPATVFGRTVEVEMNEIISLSPLATEVILSSPSQDALVAVSDYCNKRGNDELMTVGTPLIPDVDKIIQLKPDCLIVQTPLSESDKAEIEENGITVFELGYPENLDGLKEIYRSVTAITHGADIATFESERVAADISEKLNLYTLALDGQNKLNAVMLFSIYGMVATPDTMEGELLEYFFDVKDFGKNYMAESIEAVVATNPEVLIVSDKISEEQLAEMGLGETDAVANGRVFYVDIQQFENLSIKSIKTLSGIANRVYGSVIKPPVIEKEE
ncbi:MAG: hypothetical protein E7488_08380 [Ruminococcaceae bacterium]|nr:hypothetical protein [Oscillospiraceae bacterium]